MLALIKYPLTETEAVRLFKAVLQQSYQENRQQAAGTVTALKEEISMLYEKAGQYLSKKLVLPVNNFLKDIAQIDHELRVELVKENIEISSSIKGMYLEENY